MTATEIVARVRGLDPSERAAFVRQACGTDTVLFAEVESLLQTDPSLTATIVAARQEKTSGSTIGPYRLVRQLGEGGMGVVYQAQQLQPIRRDVALKIIKPGMDSRRVIARFESERQALAMMDHANIAHVFDAGTTDTGLPYFVMELVHGVLVTEYCDSARLAVKQRIELFIPACQAIQHAHQKGIIHRDIKPSNILVAEQDGRPVVKVIDFGLAKALGYQLSDATAMTDVGTVVGTLDYMSPEQARLTTQDVDTRADVYSLGAVLYELLTGTTPLGRERPEGYLDTLKRIQDEEPVRPSTRLRKSATSAEIAAHRRSDPSGLPKLLHGELDWITMKALEKERTRRYETVNGLVRDLQRYLQGEPVEAAPASAAYRMGKFVRRHRVWLAAATACVAMLVAGVVVSAWMAVRATRAEAEARAVNEFLQHDLLAQASAYKQGQPNTKPDPNLTVRAALDRAAARVEGKFARQPLVEASIRYTIGSAYIDLSQYEDAERQFERALSLRRRELGEKHPDTLAVLGSLAAAYERHGDFKKAEPLYKQVVELQQRVLGADHPDTLTAMNGLAVTYANEGQFAKAEAIFERLVPLEQRVFGEEHFQTLRAMGNLAATYDVEGKHAQAEALLLQTLDKKRRALGDENPETLDTMINLAQVYLERGEYAKAEPLYDTALAAYRRVLGDGHYNTINAMNALAVLYRNRGDTAKAEALADQALAAARKSLGDDHPRTLDSMGELAQAYASEGRYPQAADLFMKLLEARRRVLGGNHPDTLDTMVSLGRARLKEHQFTQAEAIFREALPLYEKAMPDDWQRYDCQSLLGGVLAGQKKVAAAEPLLLSGYEGIFQRRTAMATGDRARLTEAGERIVQFYQSSGMPDPALEWKQKLANSASFDPPSR
jgi:non-specific serine/threonine protein kinase/serine/threonine-protein kinase